MEELFLLDEVEKEMICKVFEKYYGKWKSVVKDFNIFECIFYWKIKEYGLE